VVAASASPVTLAKCETVPTNNDARRDVSHDDGEYHEAPLLYAQGTALSKPYNPFLNDWASEELGRAAAMSAAAASMMPDRDVMMRTIMERFRLEENMDTTFFEWASTQSMPPHFQHTDRASATTVNPGTGQWNRRRQTPATSIRGLQPLRSIKEGHKYSHLTSKCTSTLET
jgi:hypothetical protein